MGLNIILAKSAIKNLVFADKIIKTLPEGKDAPPERVKEYFEKLQAKEEKEKKIHIYKTSFSLLQKVIEPINKLVAHASMYKRIFESIYNTAKYIQKIDLTKTRQSFREWYDTYVLKGNKDGILGIWHEEEKGMKKVQYAQLHQFGQVGILLRLFAAYGIEYALLSGLDVSGKFPSTPKIPKPGPGEPGPGEEPTPGPEEGPTETPSPDPWPDYNLPTPEDPLSTPIEGIPDGIDSPITGPDVSWPDMTDLLISVAVAILAMAAEQPEILSEEEAPAKILRPGESQRIPKGYEQVGEGEEAFIRRKAGVTGTTAEVPKTTTPPYPGWNPSIKGPSLVKNVKNILPIGAGILYGINETMKKISDYFAPKYQVGGMISGTSDMDKNTVEKTGLTYLPPGSVVIPKFATRPQLISINVGKVKIMSDMDIKQLSTRVVMEILQKAETW